MGESGGQGKRLAVHQFPLNNNPVDVDNQKSNE
jgi:hypothetical protein